MTDPAPGHRTNTRPPLLCAALAAVSICFLLAAAPCRASRTQIAGSQPDTDVYLQQLGMALADAQSSISDLQYYLPLASVNDPNDPTWGLAQQASDSVRGDADLLETLSPPDALAPVNDALIAALHTAASSADSAIDALSGGDTATGQARLDDFRGALAALAHAEAGLPDQPQPASTLP